MAGVSPAAVSRYFNGGPLSQEKKKSIAEAIEKTGYRPNLMAQTMRTGRIRQIGVIVPRVFSESVSLILDGVSQELSLRGYLTVIGCSDGDQEREAQYINILQDNRVAGIILMATTLEGPLREALLTCKIPVVVTGQWAEEFPCVYHDDMSAMHDLAQEMIGRGHTRLAYIGVREDDIAAGLLRRMGVQAAMREAGLDADRMPYAVSTFDAACGREKMEELLAQDPQIDGVICATDTIALGAMSALRSRGKRIPEDVALAGLGGGWLNEIPESSLTTVRYEYQECGRLAAKMLLSRIENEEATDSEVKDQIMLKYRLIKGDTT